MQGTIFVEFLSMVEEKYGLETVDHIIEKSKDNLETEGAYTSIGTYAHAEILTLLNTLIDISNESAENLLELFGEYLANSFRNMHPEFFTNKNFIEFLQSIDGFIHQQVRAIYPQANPPKILVEKANTKKLDITYSSHRPFASLAIELIKSCAVLYDTKIRISSLTVNEEGNHAEFNVEIIND